MRAHFDSPTHGEVYVSGLWEREPGGWHIESATDQDGNEVDLDREDEWCAEDALERAVEKEMAA